MKKKFSILMCSALLGFSGASANAAVIDLFEIGVNIDGAFSSIGGFGGFGDPVPGTVDDSGFNYTTGLGVLDITLTGAGAHNALVFVDHEIDEAINTFFNENATLTGALLAGQSAEADEPGFALINPGDIYDNAIANSLDNSQGVLAGSEDDVSMAIGWDFILAAGQTAVARFFTSTINSAGSLFNIQHSDPDSGASIFFWSTLTISGTTEPPDPPIGMIEPGTLFLTLFGLLSVLGLRRRTAR